MFSNLKISSLLDQLWKLVDSMGELSTLEKIEQIAYLLLMKRLDRLRIPMRKENSFSLNTFIPENIRDITPDFFIFFKDVVFPDMVQFYSNKYSSFRKNLNSITYKFPEQNFLDIIHFIHEIYREADFSISGKNYSDADIDIFIYESLLGKTVYTGGKGELFRTPRHIVNFMVNLLEPKVKDRIIDPVCGTGGFLTGAYQYMLARQSQTKNIIDEDGFPAVSFREGLDLNFSLTGNDTDEIMVRLSTINLILHDISNSEIIQTDALQLEGKYDVVIANPPFGIKVSSPLRNSFEIQSSYFEILFLQKVFSLLNTGGKAALVLPENILTNGTSVYPKVRKMLIQKNKLEAVISLPSGAFRPYTYGKATILLFTKKTIETEDWNNNSDIWFYELKSDGYSNDENRRKQKDNPLAEAVDNYKNKEVNRTYDKTNDYFYIPLTEIEEKDFDLSYSRYKSFERKERNFPPSEELLEELLTIESEIQSDLQDLKRILNEV